MKKRMGYRLSFTILLMAFCVAVPGLSGCATSVEAADKVEPVYPVQIDEEDKSGYEHS